MTDLSRGTRSRRGVRRPGWLLLTVLLVLAIGASSALVFTNRVELLKLAVILALWAAVVAAFVSVIYRRQSDIDQAKVRDLKLVYDLQLDREISARREYELAVETQLRRELTSELRAQAADEVAGTAGRIGRAARQFGDPVRRRPVAPARARNRSRPRLQRLAAQRRIGGPGHRQPDRHRRPRGRRREHRGKPHHRRACRTPSARGRVGAAAELRRCAPQAVGDRAEERRRRAEEAPRAWSPPPPPPPPQPQPAPVSAAHTRAPIRLAATATRAPARAAARTAAATAAPRAGAGRAGAVDGLAARARGGTVDTRRDTGQQLGVAGGLPNRRLSRRAKTVPQANTSAGDAHPSRPRSSPPEPAATSSPAEPAAASSPAQPAMQSPPARRGRHSAPPDAVDPGRPPAPPTLAAESGGPPPHPEPEPPRRAAAETRRHRSAEDTGGQSVADLLARLQATPTGGGRRRRREE